MDNNALARILSEGRNFAQSASNSIASNVSAPVDGLAWAMRKLGVPMPANPMGGSDWMAEKGFTRPADSNRLSGLLGEAAGMAGPMVAAAKAPQIAGGLLRMGENAMVPRTMNSQAGAVVWHGSPHKFDAFDSSKIGTGEGAQAYGHGLYLADKQSIAAGYRDRLSNGYVDASGKQVDYGNLLTTAQSAIKGTGVSPPDHVNAIASHVQNWVDSGKSAKTYLRYNEPPAGFENAYKAAVDSFSGVKNNAGNVYKVDLPDEHIAKMLDWDSPLSKQAPEVQAIAQDLMKTGTPHPLSWMLNGEVSGMDMTGKQFLNSLQGGEAQMQKAGIPGIRYLDGGSRATGGTSNYVVFPKNEGLLQILERNGQALK